MGEDSGDTVTARADARATHCRVCATPLAADQRYCLACGTRRGALPHAVAQMVGALLEHTVEPIPRVEAALVPHAPTPRVAWPLTRLPGPQALAATLLAALGFGVLAGSLAPAPLQALASAPLLLLVNHGPSRPAASPSTSSGGGDSGAAPPTQTQQTITVTTPAPATSTPAAQTVTSPAATTPSGNGDGANSNPGGLLGLPAIKHVFLIVLADQGYSQTFDPASGDPYLSRTLPRQGELVEDYYGVAGSSLANGAALISGQGPTALTDFNCPQYTPIAQSSKGNEGQVVGSGCVYPPSAETIAGQLAAKRLTWRAYIDGIDAPAGAPPSCRHPALGASDPNYAPPDTDPYLTWRNPFVYFLSVTQTPACVADDGGFGRLARDLRTVKTTPAFSYIVPSPCEDGDSTPCRARAAAGLAPADAFLRTVLAEIRRSPAYRADGLIAITFDHAPQGGPHADANACCATPPYPNLPAPGATTSSTPASSAPTSTTPTGATTTATPTGSTTTPTDTTTTPTGGTTTTTDTTPTPAPPNPGDVAGQTTPTGGGGQVGLVLLTKYVKPGTVESIDYYNHFSLLATIESLFGLQRLGFAGDRSLPLFDSVIFNRHP